MSQTLTLSDLVSIPGGEFVMGSDDHYPEEGTAHRVHVDPFAIERTAVTNDQFGAMVADTGYSTVAEQPLDPAAYPGAPPEHLAPGSMVFVGSEGPVDLADISQWWRWIPGASWHQPEGPGSSLDGRGDHPVVQVAFADAAAYAEWAGRVLPTEAEWERAARGGLEGQPFTWGSDVEPGGQRMAKYFRGKFPWKSRPKDGYDRTTPVGLFPPNGYGLLDMAGNTWEWTNDFFLDSHPEDPTKPCCVPQNPRGGTETGSLDPNQPQFVIPRKVIKGGSFLCANEYCRRYRPAARRPQMVDTGMSHVGFRCATRR